MIMVACLKKEETQPTPFLIYTENSTFDYAYANVKISILLFSLCVDFIIQTLLCPTLVDMPACQVWAEQQPPPVPLSNS